MVFQNENHRKFHHNYWIFDHYFLNKFDTLPKSEPFLFFLAHISRDYLVQKSSITSKKKKKIEYWSVYVNLEKKNCIKFKTLGLKRNTFAYASNNAKKKSL